MAAGAPGGSRAAPKDYLSENLLRQVKARERVSKPLTDDYNLTRLHQDDQEAVELVLALVTEGFLDGN